MLGPKTRYPGSPNLAASFGMVGAHMGAGLLSFVLSYTTKMSPPERREASFASRLVTKSIVSCHTDTSRLSGGDLFSTSMTILGVAVLGGPGEVKIGNAFLKKLGSDLVVQSSR